MADHSHHDHHHHPSGTDWTEKNRAHWDKAAATYNSKHTQAKFGDMINKITAFIHQNINWIGVPFIDPSSHFESSSSSPSNHSVRVLDYACGPGTVTAALAGYATEYIGIDLSEKMVEQFNNRFGSSAVPSGDDPASFESLNAHAVVGDLFVPSGTPAHLDEEKYFNFDLAVVSGGFHHFENVELATERLTERIRPGGVLMIFDFLSHAPNDLTDDPALQTIVHHGFDEARVRQLFGDAGLEDIDIKVMNEQVMIQAKAFRTGFLARAKKPKTA